MATYKQPTICEDPNVKQYSGYFDAGSKDGTTNNYFYWLFESRNNPQNDPLLLWINGGPGCSSLFGLFLENGPCKLTNDGTSINDFESNPYSWNNNANLVFVDEPPSVGFSTGPVVGTFQEIAQDMYAFLQHLMAQFPQYFTNGFFISGESYAGMYIPQIVNYIYNQNKQSPTPIPLTGFAIGNGDSDPAFQVLYAPQMPYNSSIALANPQWQTSEEQFNADMEEARWCSHLINVCRKTGNADDCVTAKDCGSGLRHHAPFIKDNDLNKYNLNVKGDYDELEDRMVTYLNLANVQEMIGVSPVIEYHKSQHDYHHTMEESGASCENSVPLLTEPVNAGIRGLIYAGDFDNVCNWIGNEAWTVQEFEWIGKQSYVDSERILWEVNGEAVGEIRQGKNTNFTFVRVYNAGHLVPLDQPKVSLELINQFMSDTLRSTYWTTTTESAQNSPMNTASVLSLQNNIEVVTVSFGVFSLWGIAGVLLLVMLMLWILAGMYSESKKEEKETFVIV